MALLNEQRKSAAEMLADGATASSVARSLGIDRATVGRWKNDPDFQAYTQSLLEKEGEEAQEGLRARVPAALKLLDKFLAGDATIPAARATAALNVIKAAAVIDRGAGEGGETQFEERLKLLDSRQSSG